MGRQAGGRGGVVGRQAGGGGGVVGGQACGGGGVVGGQAGGRGSLQRKYTISNRQGFNFELEQFIKKNIFA